MRVYTYSQARQCLSEVLDIAKKEEVVIRRKKGEVYSVKIKEMKNSPFDIPGIKTKVKTDDILEAIESSRTI
jgi:hypothetical protein